MKYLIFITTLFLAGCSTVVKTDEEWERVNRFALDRLGTEVKWEKTQEDRKVIQEQIENLIADGLTKDEAVKIALINNRKLQSAFEEIGIAKADLVQAGLLTNPNLSTLFKFPLGGGITGLELGGFLNIADIWLIPTKKKVASTSLEKAIFKISEEVLDTAVEAKRAYTNYLFLRSIKDEVIKIQENFRELRDHTALRRDHGFATDIDVYLANVLITQIELERAKVESDLLISKYRLDNVLGLPPGKFDYEVKGSLTEGVKQKANLEDLISQAIQNRPDIQMAKLEIEKAKQELELERKRIFGDVEAGSIYEKDTEKKEFIGAEVNIQLPIFDQNQVQIAKLEYRLRQTEKELDTKVNEIRESILTTLEKRSLLRNQMNILKTKTIPEYEKASQFAEKYYNAMQIDLLYLIELHIKLLEAKKQYLELLREYEDQSIDLERLIGRLI